MGEISLDRKDFTSRYRGADFVSSETSLDENTWNSVVNATFSEGSALRAYGKTIVDIEVDNPVLGFSQIGDYTIIQLSDSVIAELTSTFFA